MKGPQVLIVPNWLSQPWFTQVRRITEKFTILPPRKDMLSLPSHPEMKHPLANQLTLLALLGRWKSLNLDPQVREILLNSWAEGSKAQYLSYLRRWATFCSENNIDQTKTSLEMGTKFLYKLYREQLGYSAIKTAVSALSSVLSPIDEKPFGKHPLIVRFLKGVFRKRPSLPKYVVTYDPDRILNYLRKLPSYKEIGLKDLTLKMKTLLSLSSGQRCQTLKVLFIEHMKFTRENVVLYIPEVIKNTTPNFHAKPIILPRFKNKHVCPVRAIQEYLLTTAGKRKSKSLIVSYFNFSAVTAQTIAKYIKGTLLNAGIDTTVFGAHSTRHASASKAVMNKVPVEKILKAGGWKNDSSFKKHYKLDII